MKFALLLIKILIFGAYFLLFVWLVSKNFVFNGYLKVEYDFKTESPFISLLYPRGRIDQEIKKDQSGDYYQRILVDPVYFDLDLPRSFEKAKVTLTYKNPNEKILELGISSGLEDENFFLQPVENKLLDKLKDDDSWDKTYDKNIVLLQKRKNYSTIESFLSQPPKLSEIAVYNYDYFFSESHPDFSDEHNGLEIYKSLRGAHEMYTYVNTGDFEFTFNFQDVNRGFGKDDIKVEVFQNNQLIFTKKIDDDGITDDSSNMSRPFDERIFIKNSPQGLYKIKIDANDDIFIRNIISAQNVLVFKGQIYFGDNVGYLNDKRPTRYEQTTVYTNTEKISAITSHSEAFQKIIFGGNSVDIDEKHIMFSVNNPLSGRDKYMDTVIVPKNDVKILGKGFFALSEKHFFMPEPFALNGDPDLDLEKYGIVYVLANYVPSHKEGDWNVKELEYELEPFNDGDNKFKMVFSFPYFHEPETEIRVSNIKIELFSEPVGVKSFISKSMNRLRKIFFGI